MIGAAFGITLAEAQDGDQAAFACLFRDLQPALLRYLQVLAPQAADDVASETWLRVVARLTGFSGGEQAFRAWVFTIARHRAIDAGRSATRRRTVPLDPGAPADMLTAPDAADLALERISTQAVLALMPGSPLRRQPASGLGEPLLDALLAGQQLSPDAPEQAHTVADMLASLTGPADPGELAAEAAARFAFAQAVSPAGGSAAAGPSKWRRPRRLPVPLTARLAAALLAAVAGLGGAAAAYADALPGPIQDLAHHAIGAPAAGHASSRLGSVRQASWPCAARKRADTHRQPRVSAAALPTVAGAAGGGGKVVAQCAGRPGPGAGPTGSQVTLTSFSATT